MAEQQTYSGLFPPIFSYKKSAVLLTLHAINPCLSIHILFKNISSRGSKQRTKIAADLNPKTIDVVRSATHLMLFNSYRLRLVRFTVKRAKKINKQSNK